MYTLPTTTTTTSTKELFEDMGDSVASDFGVWALEPNIMDYNLYHMAH